ncbi:sulfotransferase family protein [Rhodobacter capsulatus]|uniref:sulfotransferase family protein n=1 Tax=Rhodobacter capsulatus TaxID=1061 RepID=UPI004027F721
MTRLHFISGLPRSGSTLLAALLSQNPRFRAGMSSPVFGVFNATLAAMGAGNEYAPFLNETQKHAMLQGVFRGYVEGLEGPTPEVLFDTNRMWTSRMPALLRLFPGARVIACVRNPAWVLDSIEQLLRRNALDTPRLFGTEAERSSVYARADALMGRGRLIGGAHTALKEAFFGPDAGALLLLDYDTLVRHPADAMTLIYRFLGEPPFAHDFENVSYQAEEFDSYLMARGLHAVTGRVEAKPRPTCLPPDLFRRFAGLDFWTGGQSQAWRIAAAETKA